MRLTAESLRAHGLRLSVAASLAVLAACSSGGGNDPAASKQAYQNAQAAYDRGDLAAARIELLSAIKADKSNRDAHVLFARVLLDRGDGVQAQAELERAVAAGYQRQRLQHLLANAYVLQRQPQRALDLASDKSIPVEFAAYAARIRGRAQALLDRPAEAEQELTASTAMAPNDPANWVDLARFRISTGRVPDALAALDKALSVSPAYSPALLLKGGIVRNQQGLQAALPYFTQILNRDANNVDALLERAATYGDLGNEKAARADIDRVLGLIPNHPVGLYLSAVLEAKGGRYQKASEILGQTRGALDNYLPAQMLQGFVALQLNNIPKAQEAFSKVVAASPKNLAGRRLLGYTQLRANNPAGAVETLQPFTELEPEKLDPGLLAMLGSAYAQTGRLAEAQRYLELSQKASGGKAPIQTQLAMTKFAQGNLAGAEADLQQALHVDPNSGQALLSLGILRLNEKKYDEALAVADRLIKTNPKMAAAYNIRAAAMIGKRDVKGAEATFRQAISVDPNFSEGRRNLAQLLIGTGRVDDGRKELEALVARNPNDGAALALLADLALQRGQTEERLDYLRRAVLAAPNAVGPRGSLATAYAQADQLDKALTEANGLYRTNSNDPKVVQLLAALQFRAKQPQAAIQTVKTFSDANPTSAGAKAMLATAYSTAGQTALARQAFEDAMKLPNAPQEALLISLIQLDTQAKNWQGALATANRLKAKQPLLGEKAIGDINLAAGNGQAAMASYQRLYTQKPGAETLALLTSTQVRLGRAADALATINGYRKAHPTDPAGPALLADLQIAQKDWRGAIASYGSILNTPAGKSPLVLNNLAWAMYQIGDSRALPTAAAAFKAAPEAAAVQDTYGWLLVASKSNPKQGLRLLQAAASGAPRDPGVRYHLGQAYAANGMSKEARETLTVVARSGGPEYGPQAQQALASIR